MNISVEKRVQIILSLNGEGHSGVCQRFNAENPDTPINNEYVSELLRRFKQTGSVLYVAEMKERVNPAKHLNQESVDKVHHVIHEDPHTSIRRTALQTGLTTYETQRVLKEGRFHPYKLKVMQELKQNGNIDDHQRRKEMCLWLRNEILMDPDFLRTILWSDEATFTTNGVVNRQNFRLWADENPHWHTGTRNQGAQKVNVWIGMMDHHIIGPYFYDHNVNSHNYLAMLQNFVLPKLANIGMPSFFQQDGAPPHFANIVKDWLNVNFEGKWLGRGGPKEWAARSPDLTPLDFFIWGHLKNHVYQTPIESLDHLKALITAESQKITGFQLQNSLKNLEKRIHLCIQQEGSLFEHLL